MNREPPRNADFAAAIAAGGVVVLGTDTVYGLCCDAENAAAVERLTALKGRPSGKPAAVAFFSLRSALEALPELGERTRAALRALLPGPLTLLVANPVGRFRLAGGELLGIRVIDVGLDAGRPVLLTSANMAGEAEARTLAEVPPAIREAADLSIDGGTLPGTPSTVVDLGALESTGSWRIVRAGAFPEAALRTALGRLVSR